MKNIDRRLKKLAIGEPATFRNLTLVPLIDSEPVPANYLTLDEALKAKSFRITEVSDSGSVPELAVRNDGDRPVLLLDGEELVGAKQNRVLNITILVAAHTSMLIPVSCVEQGRWAFRGERHFASAKRTLYARGRAAKMGQVSESLRQHGRRASNQMHIWDDIAAAAVGFDVHSPTGAMSDVYDSQQGNIDEFEQAFEARAGQAGAVFAIAGEIAGCELFDSDATWQKLAPKLIGSYALDALAAGETAEPVAARAAAAGAFLRQVALADATSHDATGLGRDIRIGSRDLVGAALEVDERIVHLSAFRLDSDGPRGGRRGQSRLMSLARRRRNRQVH